VKSTVGAGMIGLSAGDVAEDEVMNAFVDTVFGHVSLDTHLELIKRRIGRLGDGG